VLVVALILTAVVTLILAWSISRPLEKLSKAAKRIAAGEQAVIVPVGGTGEIRELGVSFASMNQRLDARLRYFSEFAADVAHEFKSPLTSIRGAAELLAEGASDDPDARARFLSNIGLDVDRLDRMVSRLLELSRIEASSQPMTSVDVEQLVRRVVDRLSSAAKPIVLAVDECGRTLRAREADLETAIGNLIENALRFAPQGSPVTVTLAISRRDDARAPPEAVTIAVRDDGAGIPPAHVTRVFDRFFTTDQERRGTGLGLAIVKSVIEAHGGNVTVSSSPGEGTTFLVELPLPDRSGGTA
jgi:two-component system sensor histidine kinase ChvG